MGRTTSCGSRRSWRSSRSKDAARVPERLRLVADAAPASASRQAYFGPQEGWRETQLRARRMLTGRPCDGPLIIEEYDATTVIPPGWRASLDAGANIMIDRAR